MRIRGLEKQKGQTYAIDKIEKLPPTLFPEQLSKQPLRPREPFLRQHNRLRLTSWVEDVSLPEEPVHNLVIEPLPRPHIVVQCQLQECKDTIVDPVRVHVPFPFTLRSHILLPRFMHPARQRIQLRMNDTLDLQVDIQFRPVQMVLRRKLDVEDLPHRGVTEPRVRLEGEFRGHLI